MNLPEISVHRHVLAYMLSAVLVLFGIISYKDIGVDRYPYIEFPMISVTTIIISIKALRSMTKRFL